ncbi:MAG: hypothetical protein CLLPBCKN_007594 [Chroococcidiopsis cubana SAG 39.79]|uniref:Conjugal transfer protein n=1 Tax=Chroococcidiopsis cubana SAG 39.79 TaxID=388085 RepID=A0AB37USW5_9CYAN|nr:hypothetical protein [Chroococcidiopsis cubana]MDZ4878159.1 hypothetical protein [Chroococcidiopsis cubana SAG 39.79]PSB63663.1 hypothetical protein C7B79_12945 [Chroococcidiopsis cubana CCALA 043]RUT14574.1 hypothetical protein DSM107010_01200 [Chroococcidiopsis cubana SAG 39.79]
MSKQEREFRSVNRVLGQQPRLGPFPADQILPWSAIALIMYIAVKGFLQLSWLATGIAIAWGWATWWTVSANQDFFGKFIGTPRVTKGYKPFASLTGKPTNRKTKKKRHLRRRR